MSGRGRASSARGQAGQAAVELVALLLLVALALGALAAAASPRVDGRSVGGVLARQIVCATSGRCAPAERELVRAYGARDAALVRSLAPSLAFEAGERSLPVDWRRCRRPACAEAPDDAELDAHHTAAGRATAFTRLVRRGGRTYVQFWLYYPDSKTTVPGSELLWKLLARVHRLPGAQGYPGFHRDDWESVQFRVGRDGTVEVRASNHGGYAPGGGDAGWQRPTGWVRISRGSHAGRIVRTLVVGPPRRPVIPSLPAVPGTRRPQIRSVPQIPGRNVRQRSTSGEGLRLVPLETHGRRGYRPLDESVRPPWRKEVYREPEGDRS